MSKIQRTRIPSSAPDPAADEALARLLTAAAPPLAEGWADHGLPGEADAMAAFRLGPDPRAGRRPARFGKLFALKTVIAVAALSGGGVALAAATGHLPSQAGSPAPAPSRSAVSPAATARPESGVRSPGLSSSPRGHRPPARPGPGRSSSASPSPVSVGASASISVRRGSISGSAGVSVPAPSLPASLPSSGG